MHGKLLFCGGRSNSKSAAHLDKLKKMRLRLIAVLVGLDGRATAR
jgi:hypothetical protein